jgi:hypothetical protein
MLANAGFGNLRYPVSTFQVILAELRSFAIFNPAPNCYDRRYGWKN